MDKRLIAVILLLFIVLPVKSDNTISSRLYDRISYYDNLSNRHTTAFAEDKNGYVWIGTSFGLNRYNGTYYYHYFADDNNPHALDNNYINCIYIDSKDRLWVGTMTGINLYTDKDDFKHPVNRSLNNPVNAITERADGKITLSTQDGLIALNPETLEMERSRSGEPFTSTLSFTTDKQGFVWTYSNSYAEIYKLNDDLEVILMVTIKNASKINDLSCNHKGELCISTNSGLYLADPLSGNLIDPPKELERLIQNNNLLFAAEAEENTILIGIENQGVFLYNSVLNHSYQLLDSENFPVLNKYNYLIDSRKNAWLPTNRKGYLFFSSREKRFNPDQTLNTAIGEQTVGAILTDKANHIWLALPNSGFLFYDPLTSETKRYDNTNLSPFQGKNISIQSAYIDSQNRLWTIINNALVQYMIEGDQLRFEQTTSGAEQIYYLAEDKEGNMWFVLRNNITVLAPDGSTRTIRTPSHILFMNCFFTKRDKTYVMSYNDGIFQLGKDGQFIPLTTDALMLNKLKNATYMYEDSDHIIWIGTASSGIVRYDSDTEQFTLFDQRQGLVDNSIMAIQEDNDHHLWISTSDGLSKFDQATNSFINYQENDRTINTPYYFRSIYKDQNGMMYFGHHNGITYFDPQKISSDNQEIPLRIEGLLIYNQLIDLHDPKSPFQTHIGHLKEIELKHNQNMLSIYFSGIDFDAGERLNYAYKVEGFDSDWNYIGDFRRASIHLPPGNYTFMLRTQNADGQWSRHPLALGIRIKPSPWLSPFAIFAYLFVIIALVILIFRYTVKQKLVKERLALFVKEREMKEEINEMKINFFTNISHEFRTPLSLIHGPLSELAKEKNLSLYAHELVRTMERSVNRMLGLTKQLLDYNKLDINAIPKLSVVKLDISLLTEGIVNGFRFMATERKIDLRLQQPDSLQIYVDEDKYGKVLTNMLSNALKFTPPQGTVEVVLDILSRQVSSSSYKLPENRAERYLRIQVSDTGIGVSKQQMPELFKRYQRLSSEDKLPAVEGFGIGLHYSKSLVDLHKGAIKAEQRKDNGMIFSFLLPFDENIYQEDEKAAAIAPDTSTDLSVMETNDADDSARKHILLVEDDAELRHYLHRILNTHYRVTAAKNGREALEQIEKETPEMVITDVVMPEMDGYELCQSLKNNPDYCHLPIILLTARTTLSSQIEGLETGADAYITKPFDPSFLLASISGLFKNRQRIQRILQQVTRLSEQTERHTQEMLNPHDKKLMNKLYALMEAQLDDPELNINYIIKEIGMSRTGFYMKIKSITGQNPIAFLNTYRLNRAAELIRQNSYTLSEIAAMTGFNSPSSFSRSFKKQFNVSPRDYQG